MFEQLVQIAWDAVEPRELSSTVEVGNVAAAILTAKGNIYTGLSIETACSMGFCAEHSAAAAMITAGESHIIQMVAIHKRGNILPPCGRCREFIAQIDDKNLKTQVLINRQTFLPLEALLPYDWRVAKNQEYQ